MTEQDIEKLADALATKVRSIVPKDEELWTTEDCCGYLRCEIRQFCERIKVMPGFPAAIRIPTQGSSHPRPLWKAVEVIAFANKHKEKKRAA